MASGPPSIAQAGASAFNPTAFLQSEAGQTAMQGVMKNATLAERLGHAGITAAQGLSSAYANPMSLRGAAAYAAPSMLAMTADAMKGP